jgi:GDP-mannose transporter
VVYLPLPTVVSFIQIIFSTVQILVMKYAFGVKVDELEYDKMKAYALYICAFVLSIYANMKALALSNVETVIVFRACVPVAVTVIEVSTGLTSHTSQQFPVVRLTYTCV